MLMVPEDFHPFCLHEKAFPSKAMQSYSEEYFYEASAWGLFYHFHVVLFWHDHR